MYYILINIVLHSEVVTLLTLRHFEWNLQRFLRLKHAVHILGYRLNNRAPAIVECPHETLNTQCKDVFSRRDIVAKILRIYRIPLVLITLVSKFICHRGLHLVIQFIEHIKILDQTLRIVIRRIVLSRVVTEVNLLWATLCAYRAEDRYNPAIRSIGKTRDIVEEHLQVWTLGIARNIIV